MATAPWRCACPKPRPARSCCRSSAPGSRWRICRKRNWNWRVMSRRGPADGSRSPIGVVDDDEGILREVRALLEGEEFTVRAFSNGAEALGEFSREPPSLAILDIKMPHLDGIELLSQLRKVHVMPVIFLTSKDDEVDEVLGFRMGADDYIRKPFSPRLLVERVRTLLRRVERQKERGDEPVIRYGDLTL